MNRTNAKRISSTHEEMINAPAEKIFPLACPVEELKWIDGWGDQHELVYTDSGVNEKNCIFKEYMSGLILFDKPVTTTWITVRHDPKEKQVEFVLVIGQKATIKFDLDIKGEDNGFSKCTWAFIFTALDEETDSIDEKVIKEKLVAIQTSLASMLKHYCETGGMMKLDFNL